MNIRVLVYNVHGFRSGADDVAAAVADARPDIALINECGSYRKLGRFAELMEMRATSTPLPRVRRAARNAILVRRPWKVAASRTVALPRGQKRAYPRALLAAQVHDEYGAGASLNVLCTHLGLLPGERAVHAGRILDTVAGTAGPLLIGGDLNERPGQPAAAAFGTRLWDTWIRVGPSTGETFPASAPEARIDYLFASEDLTPRRAVVLGSPAAKAASDHLPLVVDLANGYSSG
ncbi:MAG: endonuclease/exonuclease/phosphatase family protein [Actinomycetota bacterium]